MYIYIYMGFPHGLDSKESACNAGDLGLIPQLRRSPGEVKGSSLQYSGLENSMDHLVHGVAKSQTRLSNFDFSLSCMAESLCCPPETITTSLTDYTPI